MNKFDEALVAIEKEIELNPKAERAYANKFSILNRMGKHEEALVIRLNHISKTNN